MEDGSDDKASIFQKQDHSREWVVNGPAKLIATCEGVARRGRQESPGNFVGPSESRI